MTKHTPGPWVVNPIQLNQIATPDARLEIARATVLRDQHETIANARLIAAAPELLEALKAIVKSLADQDDEGLIEHAQQMIDARAAIAKATNQESTTNVIA